MICFLHQLNQIDAVLVLVCIYRLYRRTNGMTCEWSYKNQKNSSYRGKFQWNFDQGKGNLVRVSREFELTELELTE